MITLKLTEQELGALTGLIDLGVKAGGLQVAKAAGQILDKLEEAVKEAKDSNVIDMKEKANG